MSRRTEPSSDDLFIELEDIINADSVPTHPRSLEDFLEPFRTDQSLRNIPSTSSNSSESCDLDRYELSASSPPINQSYSHQIPSEVFHIVQQPFQGSKLRYRADYNREKRRVGSLTHKIQRTPFRGPAIAIPQCYLNPNDDYYIRITLLTTRYSETKVHYFHPYELEDAKNEGYNDRINNSVWFPIGLQDSLKNFPFLRIVKKKSFEIHRIRSLRAFDCYPQTFSDSVSAAYFIDEDTDAFKEHSIERSQLAFTLARKTLVNDQICMVLQKNTTVFSEEMTENKERQPDDDSSNEQASPTSRNFISKYAPKSGTNGSHEEMLMYFRKKLELKKNGYVNVTIECNSPETHWTHTVRDFEAEDRMISFAIPTFPYTITNPTTVEIIVQQQNTLLGKVKYSYLP